METITAASTATPVSPEVLDETLDRLLAQYGDLGRVLLVPPDFTRFYSCAGEITQRLYRKLSRRGSRVEIMPAAGTHAPMTQRQRERMFGTDIPEACFLQHHWQTDTVRLGEVPEEVVRNLSAGRYAEPIRVEVNRRLMSGEYDRIFSIGQVVPHEVVGMANYSKNLFVGLGGRQMINQSHMLGAVCGLETILGRTDTPVRGVFDYAQAHFLDSLPLTYLLTVVRSEGARTALHGLFIGETREPYERAAALSQALNITWEERRAEKVVAYLEPEEFVTTWVANKGIYRTRMLVADGGELLLLAPGVRGFGENPEVDALIRRYGYHGTPYLMEQYRAGAFGDAIMAAAHLIHGSSEGRFQITYAVDPAHLSQEEVEAVGFRFADVREAMRRYSPETLQDGFQTLENGEEIYFVRMPALGLWRAK